MTKEPSLRAKAMYIMFACALIFGLAAAVVTAAPASAQLSLFVTASPDKGLSPLTTEFTVNSMGIGPWTVEFDLDGAGPGGYGPLIPAGSMPYISQQTVNGVLDVVAVGVRVTDSLGVQEVTSINIGVDPVLRPDPKPGAVRDVKGSQQKFVIVNLPNIGVSESQLESLVLTYGGIGALGQPGVQAQGPDTQVVRWEVIPGKNKETIGDQGSGADIIIKGGGPTYPLSSWDSYDPQNPPVQQNWIEVWTWDPGDCKVKVYLDADLDIDGLAVDEDLELESEKKWGEISKTLLDLDHSTPAWDDVEDVVIPGNQDGTCTDALEEATGSSNEVADWVWATFITSDDPSVPWFEQRAGHAQVNWWIIQDDEDGYNEQAVRDVMNALNPKIPDSDECSTCGRYADWANTSPRDLLDELAYGLGNGIDLLGEQQALHTEFTTIPALSTPGEIGAGFNYDEPPWGHPDNLLDRTFAWTTTQDALPMETRGLTTVNLVNDGTEEEVLIVTLVEYPEDYSGENPICIEMGKKRFVEEPEYPISLVKTPQVRWAGEKIVLEIDWTDVIDSLEWDLNGDSFEPDFMGDLIAVYHIDQQSIGTLYPAGDNAFREKDGGDIWVKVAGWSPGPSNPVSEVILETEFQGKADVEVALYRGNWGFPPPGMMEPIIWPGAPIVNTGFVVFYLALEEINWRADLSSATEELNPISSTDTEGESADIVVDVKGWFTNSQLPLAIDPDTNAVREEKLQDCDNDGIYESALPRGRWVLPDDWVALAGGTGAITTRPMWDMMDMANNDPVEGEIESSAVNGELGPFTGPVKTTLDPGMAMPPNIGPFNTLQRWSIEDMWVTAATVPSSLPMTFVRNTVIPDGKLTMWDAPMPQALVSFEITSEPTMLDATLSTLDKGTLVGVDKDELEGKGYGYDSVNKVYPSPFYAVEIPSSVFITAVGYNYNSWGIDGPYEYWTDLELRSRISDTKEPTDPADKTAADLNDVEVYSDNHGIAGVTVDALGGLGDVLVVATVDFPNILKTAQYCAMVSGPQIVSWGDKEMNPWFLADEEVVEAGDLVTFENLTVGGERPYVRAQWDFNEDSIWDEDLTGTEAQVLADVVWDTTGVPSEEYTVLLCMTDSLGIQRCEDRKDYIEITGIEPPDVDTETWNFAFDTYAPRCLPSDYTGTIDLTDPAVIATVPDCVQGVYYEDGTFWGPGAPGSTLTYLGGGQDPLCYNIAVFGAPCTWDVPLMP